MTQFKSERSETVLTPTDRPWRIAWPFLHEKRTKQPDGKPLEKPRYDATLIAPKLHTDPMQCPNYQLLARLCMEAASKSWGNFPQGGAWPIRDGDAPIAPRAPTIPGQAPAAPKDYPWRKGSWIVNIANNLDPGPRIAILQNGQAVDIPARTINGRTFYKSGDFVVVSLNAYTFHNKTFGCNFGFEGVLFVGEGEAIGSSGPRSADQIFGAVAGSIRPQQPMQQPAQGAPMAAPQPVGGYMPQNPTVGAVNPAPVPSAGFAHPNAPAPQPTAASATYHSNPAPPVAPVPPASAPAAAAPNGLPPFPVR